jgi:hypothetical protein
MENFMTRFVIENRPYYFRWEWGTEEFSCQVTDGKYAWDGKADQKYIQSKLRPDGMEFSEIMTLLKQCLRDQDIQQKRFSYQMYASQVQGDIIFGWKIKIEDDTEENGEGEIFIKGNLPLKRQNPHLAIQNILENFYSKIIVIEKQNETLMQSHKKLQEQRDGALKQMKQMTDDKLAMEHELMQKFVLVLNEKKKKIRELTDKVPQKPLPQKPLPQKPLPQKQQEIPELKYEEIKIRVIEPKKKNRMSFPSSYPTFGIDSMNSTEIHLLNENDPIKTVVRKRHRALNKNQDSEDNILATPVTPVTQQSQEHGIKEQSHKEQSQGFVFQPIESPKIPSSISLALTTKLLKKKELDADDLLEFVLHHQ